MADAAGLFCRLSLIGNIGIHVAFGLGTDAEVISGFFGDLVSATDLVQLAKYHAYVAPMMRGKTRDPVLMQITARSKTKLDDKKLQMILDQVRRRCRRREAAVQKNIFRSPGRGGVSVTCRVAIGCGPCWTD